MKKKEQFSLQLWDRLKKDNIPHTFETREGRVVTQVTKFEGVDTYIIIAGVLHNVVQHWKADGFYYYTKSDTDLFIVWEEEQLMLDGWINVYLNKELYFYPTKELAEEADKYSSKARIACVKVSIPYTKGEGLNNG